MNNTTNKVAKDVVTFAGVQIPVRMLNGEYVLSVHDIAAIHNTTDRAIQNNFSRRKQFFTHKVDFFVVTSLSQCDPRTSDGIQANPNGAIYFTFHGYGLLVKGMNGELAEKIHKEFVDTYFDMGDMMYGNEISDERYKAIANRYGTDVDPIPHKLDDLQGSVDSINKQLANINTINALMVESGLNNMRKNRTDNRLSLYECNFIMDLIVQKSNELASVTTINNGIITKNIDIGVRDTYMDNMKDIIMKKYGTQLEHARVHDFRIIYDYIMSYNRIVIARKVDNGTSSNQ